MIESPICSCGWDINIGRIADPGCLEHKTWNTGCPRCKALEAKLKVAEALCRKFVLKVETGRAISRETYAECKAFLEVLKG